MVALCTKLQTSTFAGPMLRVNCLIFSPLAKSLLTLFLPLVPAHT
jgi:hypothetical protein